MISILFIFLFDFNCAENTENLIKGNLLGDNSLKGLLSKAKLSRYKGDIVKAKSLYRKAVEIHNSHEAINSLGEIYLRGEFFSAKNYTLARTLFKKSSFRGNPKALYNLAFMSHYGLTKDSLMTENLNLYLSSVLENDKAVLVEGYKHKFGYSVPRSCKTALKYYKTAAENVYNRLDAFSDFYNRPDRELLSKLGKEHQYEKETIDYIEMEAKGNDGNYQFEYGKLLMSKNYRIRMEKDEILAMEMFKAAAKKGNAAAMERLAQFYFKGKFVEKNLEKTISLLEESAKSGYFPSLNRLGEIYLGGFGLPLDRAKAESYFKKSAENDNPEGMFLLAQLKESSKAFQTPIEKAEIQRLYRNSAAKGYIPAILTLARRYQNFGDGINFCSLSVGLFQIVAQRSEESRADFRLAAERYLAGDVHHSLLLQMDLAYQGFEDAQMNSAFLLETQRGLIKEPHFHEKETGENDNGGSDHFNFIGKLKSIWENLFRTKKTKESFKANTAHLNSKNSFSKSFSEKNLKLFTDSFRNSAYFFYSLASDQGNSEAKRKLGDFHFSHTDFGSNALLFSHQSFYLYRALSKADIPAGEFNLRKGGALSSNERLLVAYELYNEASELFDAESTYNLGYMHHYGIGVSKNLEWARTFYEISLAQSPKAFLPAKTQLFIVGLEKMMGERLSGHLAKAMRATAVFFKGEGFYVLLMALSLWLLYSIRGAH